MTATKRTIALRPDQHARLINLSQRLGLQYGRRIVLMDLIAALLDLAERHPEEVGDILNPEQVQ